MLGSLFLLVLFKNSEAKAIITDAENLEKILAISPDLPNLQTIIVTGGKSTAPVLAFDELI